MLTFYSQNVKYYINMGILNVHKSDVAFFLS